MTTDLKFISFEGIDFSGKTTQVELLANELKKRGEKVIVMREPGGTAISEKIREILLDKKNDNMTNICELLLYSAARHQLVLEKISKELESGNFVIADRYVDSTIAYQGYGRKISLNLINEINKVVTEGVLPSLTFFLDLKPESIIERKQNRKQSSDRLEDTGIEFYKRIREGYLKIAENKIERIKVINADKSITQIKDEIWEFVLSKITLK